MDLGAWNSLQVRAISDDGLTLAGDAFNPDGNTEGWVAFLGRPDCAGDITGDLQVSLVDLTILLSNFGVPSGAAPDDGDLDGDGDVDLDDLTAMLEAFGTDCRP